MARRRQLAPLALVAERAPTLARRALAAMLAHLRDARVEALAVAAVEAARTAARVVEAEHGDARGLRVTRPLGARVRALARASRTGRAGTRSGSRRPARSCTGPLGRGRCGTRRTPRRRRRSSGLSTCTRRSLLSPPCRRRRFDKERWWKKSV